MCPKIYLEQTSQKIAKRIAIYANSVVRRDIAGFLFIIAVNHFFFGYSQNQVIHILMNEYYIKVKFIGDLCNNIVYHYIRNDGADYRSHWNSIGLKVEGI